MSKNDLMTPPHNIEAEKSVLGSILLDKRAIIHIADMIQAPDFYSEKHGLIYESILTLFQKHQDIDAITVANYLEEKGVLKDIGGASYLTELMQCVPTATHVEEYAGIVREKSTLRKLIDAGHHIVAYGMEGNDEIPIILGKAEKEILGVSQTFLKEKFIHIKDILEASYERIAELSEQEEGDALRGIPTGFHDLDKKLSGLQPSDLIILAARPSMGKTALALNIGQNVAQKGYTVGIFSLEMSKDQLVERLFCSMLKVSSWRLRTGRLEAEELSRLSNIMDQLSSMNLFIDDSAGSTMIELSSKARRLQAERGLDLLIVDYLQLINSSGKGYGNRVMEISEISRALKILARELNIPVLALSQLSRAVESRDNKRPQLSDLRESGSIEQDADLVLFLYRADYYATAEEQDKSDTTEILIAKHRTGPTGKVEVGFNKEEIRFYNLEKYRTSEEYNVTEEAPPF